MNSRTEGRFTRVNMENFDFSDMAMTLTATNTQTDRYKTPAAQQASGLKEFTTQMSIPGTSEFSGKVYSSRMTGQGTIRAVRIDDQVIDGTFTMNMSVRSNMDENASGPEHFDYELRLSITVEGKAFTLVQQSSSDGERNSFNKTYINGNEVPENAIKMTMTP